MCFPQCHTGWGGDQRKVDFKSSGAACSARPTHLAAVQLGPQPERERDLGLAWGAQLFAPWHLWAQGWSHSWAGVGWLHGLWGAGLLGQASLTCSQFTKLTPTTQSSSAFGKYDYSISQWDKLNQTDSITYMMEECLNSAKGTVPCFYIEIQTL